MAKLSTLLREIQAPDGWYWEVEPGRANTGGILKMQNWDLIRGADWVAKMRTLETWLKKYELGIKPARPAYIRANNRQNGYAYVSHEVKLTTHKSSLRKYFKGSVCARCGTENEPLALFCKNIECAKALACTWCSIQGRHIHADGKAAVCDDCAGECKKCGGPTDPNWPACFKCEPRGHCHACSEPVSGKAYKEYEVASRRTPDNQPIPESIQKVVYCQVCRENLCANCGKYADRNRTYVPAIDGEVCRSCYQRWFDEYANVREEFEEQELTASRLVIPTTDGRDWVRSVGIEIEGGGNQVALANALFEAKLAPRPEDTIRRHGYAGNHDMPMHVEYDASVDWELVFNKFDPSKSSDMQKVVSGLKIARDQVKQGNCHLDLRCGCHIHIDAHKVGMKGAFNLWALFAYAEDVVFRIAASRWATHRSVRYGRDNGAAQPVPKGPYVDRVAFGNALNGGAQDRYYALSFANFWNAVNRACRCGAIRYEAWEKCTCDLGKCTFEFRVFNSTLNPRKLHAYIALSQAFVAKAMTMDEITVADFPPMEWNNKPLKNMKPAEIDKAIPEWEKRLSFVFREFPLTKDEKESLLYCIQHSDLKVLGEDFLAGLIPTHQAVAA